MKQSTRNGLTAAAVVVGIAAMAYFPYMATKRMVCKKIFSSLLL
jgi:hypothetical protein